MSDSVAVTAGILFWRRIRNLREQVRFLGHDVDLYEGPGWFTRRFIFKGEERVIAGIRSALQRAQDSLED